ncbi:MAG TPA: hypothetical protein VNU19_09390 [Candidatus Acidoferrum sp.]|nr:hypothetical protein [Candidatus Acidoferrum sp.]
MSDTNKNLVRRHFEEIWNQRKMAARDELMADDFPEHAAAPLAATALGKVHGANRHARDRRVAAGPVS